MCGSSSFPQYWQTEPGKHGRVLTKKNCREGTKNVKNLLHNIWTLDIGQTSPGKHRGMQTKIISVKASMGCVNVSLDIQVFWVIDISFQASKLHQDQ